ncbi:MAG TPA: type II secretion system protein N [Sphingomonas sp.]|nr:type II secretion system protein N [Sphingomonas sp.]
MRLKLDARGRAMLRRLPSVNVYSAAELLLMAGLAVQAARLVWTIVTPVSPLGDWRPASVADVAAPIATISAFDPFFRLSNGGSQPAVVTALQLTLFGTRIDEATGRGSAIIAGPDGVQNSIAVGEEIQPGVRLKAVAFDHVTIDRGGAAEDLFLDQSGGAAPVQAGAPGTAGALPPQPGGGVSVAQLRQDIGFIPRIDRGRVSGLVVRSQGSGAAFRQAGLRDGDVVTSMGGRPVTGPDDLDRIARDFAGGGNVPITVERGQDTLPLAITIAGPQQ